MLCEKDTQSLQLLAHWNYFLAIEQDLIALSRFIEFSQSNYEAYSIELTRLLMASVSEIDVLMKEICVSEKEKSDMGISDYRSHFLGAEPWDIHTKLLLREVVTIPRYNLYFTPWDIWNSNNKDAPEWWQANNKVKHHRSTHFNQANLKNVLNAAAALYQSNIHLIRNTNEKLFHSGLLKHPELFELDIDPFSSTGMFKNEID